MLTILGAMLALGAATGVYRLVTPFAGSWWALFIAAWVALCIGAAWCDYVLPREEPRVKE